MPRVTANDCDFYYEMVGEGPAIVFVHGETHTLQIFDAQVPALSKRYRCLAYDRRGHGRTALPEYGYSLWNQTNDLKALLDALGIERGGYRCGGDGHAHRRDLVDIFASHDPEHYIKAAE